MRMFGGRRPTLLHSTLCTWSSWGLCEEPVGGIPRRSAATASPHILQPSVNAARTHCWHSSRYSLLFGSQLQERNANPQITQWQRPRFTYMQMLCCFYLEVFWEISWWGDSLRRQRNWIVQEPQTGCENESREEDLHFLFRWKNYFSCTVNLIIRCVVIESFSWCVSSFEASHSKTWNWNFNFRNKLVSLSCPKKVSFPQPSSLNLNIFCVFFGCLISWLKCLDMSLI